MSNKKLWVTTFKGVNADNGSPMDVEDLPLEELKYVNFSFNSGDITISQQNDEGDFHVEIFANQGFYPLWDGVFATMKEAVSFVTYTKSFQEWAGYTITTSVRYR